MTHRLSCGLFALPLWVDGDEVDGLIYPQDPVCRTCSHQECVRTPPAEDGRRTRLCSEGLAYRWVQSSILVRGLVVLGWRAADEPARWRASHRRRQRERREQAVTLDALNHLIEGLGRVTRDQRTLSLHRLQQAVERRFDPEEIEQLVRTELDRRTSASVSALLHDRMQYLATILQSIDEVMRLRYVGEAMVSEMPQLNRLRLADARAAWEREKAIVTACELMKIRQQAADLIASEDASFDLCPRCPHKVFHKTRMLLLTDAKDRGVSIHLGRYHQLALMDRTLEAVVVFALLENAVKYAPVDTAINVRFVDTATHVTCEVRSLGPRIAPDEREKIFFTGVRGKAAEELLRGEGSGIGLAQARRATKGWGRLWVRQAARPSRQHSSFFETTFYWQVERSF